MLDCLFVCGWQHKLKVLVEVGKLFEASVREFVVVLALCINLIFCLGLLSGYGVSPHLEWMDVGQAIGLILELILRKHAPSEILTRLLIEAPIQVCAVLR